MYKKIIIKNKMIPYESIPLYICCPGEKCDKKAIYWYHALCGHKVFIDGHADIYCGGKEKGCLNPSTRYILNWFFRCNNEQNHKGEYFRFDAATLSFALSTVISIASTIKELSEEDQIKLQKIYLSMTVRLITEAQMEMAKLDKATHALEAGKH